MKYLILSILLLGQIHLFGQESKVYPIKENRVIVVPGLNMRAQPSLVAKKVSFIPFGKKVQILEPQKFYKDTVGKIKNYRQDLLRDRSPNPLIDGYWIKARYRGKTGYVVLVIKTLYLRLNIRHDMFILRLIMSKHLLLL